MSCSSGRVSDQRAKNNFLRINTKIASSTSFDTSFPNISLRPNASNSVPFALSLPRVYNMTNRSKRVFDQGSKCSSQQINTTIAGSKSLDTSVKNIYHHPNVLKTFPRALSLPRVHHLTNNRVERRQLLPIGVINNHAPTQRYVNPSIIYPVRDYANQGHP